MNSFAPPCDPEWTFTIAPLINRWISSSRPKNLPREGRIAAVPSFFSPTKIASNAMPVNTRITNPPSIDVSAAFTTRLETFKKELAQAKEIKHLDRRIKRVAAVRAQIKALVEAYHATLV